MVEGGQEPGDGAGVGRDADPRLLVGAEDVVQDCLGAHGKGFVGLALVAAPELVELGEVGFELEGGEHLGDVGLGGRDGVVSREEEGEKFENGLELPCLISGCRCVQSCPL